MEWISVRKWRTFQHYDPAKRQPPWIKNYTDLMNSDAYLRLGASERAILHGIWLLYASSRAELSLSPGLLSRRLSLRVRKEHLVTLNHAGFIDFVASATLAEGYHDASAEVEVEVEKEDQDLRTSSCDLDVDDPDEEPGPEDEPLNTTTKNGSHSLEKIDFKSLVPNLDLEP